MPVTAAIGGIGSIVGGIMQAHAANSAAKIQSAAAQKVADMATQAGATAKSDVNAATQTGINTVNSKTDEANQTLGGVYAGQKNNLNPYLDAGTQGVQSLASMLQPGGELTKQFAFDPSQIASDPGYQFRMEQGQQALERSAAAGGSLQGGGTLKAITQYGQGLASTEFGNAYTRALNTFQTNRNNTMSSLAALTGIGQTATGQFNQAAQNYGDQSANNTFRSGLVNSQTGVQGAEYGGQAGIQAANIAGNALTGGANAQAAGKVGAANAWSGALGGVTNAAQTYSLGSMLKPPGAGAIAPPLDRTIAGPGV